MPKKFRTVEDSWQSCFRDLPDDITIRELEHSISYYTDLGNQKPHLRKFYEARIEWERALLKKLKHE